MLGLLARAEEAYVKKTADMNAEREHKIATIVYEILRKEPDKIILRDYNDSSWERRIGDICVEGIWFAVCEWNAAFYHHHLRIIKRCPFCGEAVPGSIVIGSFSDIYIANASFVHEDCPKAKKKK